MEKIPRREVAPVKKVLAVAGVCIILVLIAVVTWSTVAFNRYSPADPEIAPDARSLGYFLGSYEESRNAFLEKANSLKKSVAGWSLTSVPVPSVKDGGLTVDLLYLPAQKAKKRLLILSSGVHGVEGYTGSALQRMFLDEFAAGEFLAETGVLIIHAMNPYGFKNLRRVTENNVDLNRNCSSDPALYSSKNEGYPAVRHSINPEGKVDVGSLSNVFFHFKAVTMMLKASMKSLRQAILQGQYEYPEGLYFGGKKLEPQVAGISPVVARTVRNYPLVMNIDLHTGYGARGVLHLFPNPIKDAKIRSMVEKTFEGYRIDWGDGADFYTVTGDFSTYLGSLMTRGTYLPMTFEYGTLDSQTTMGSLKSLHITMLENQGVQHGYAGPDDEKTVRTRFREMYYPSSPAWRAKVMTDTRELLRSALAKFAAL